jgi:hypothetical protein
LPSYIIYKQNYKEDWADFDKTVENFYKNNLIKAFPLIGKIIKLYLTKPIGSVHAERSFSCMKLLKTWTRTTITNDRLSDLGVIKMSYKEIDKLEYDDIINEFAVLTKRRMSLIK